MKPTGKPEVATTNVTLPTAGTDNKLEPTTTIKNVGWDQSQKPAAQNFNWLFNKIREWVDYFETTTDDINDPSTGILAQANTYTDNAFGQLVGSVVAWPTASIPTGWIACDGSAVSRTTYASLFAVLGTEYGAGDGSTTFNLPDYRGEFLRGTDSGAGNDPDAASRTDRGDGTTGDNVGTKQDYEIQAHTHTIPVEEQNVDRADLVDSDAEWNAGSVETTGSTGGLETRPRNVGVIWIIKT